MPSNFKKSTQFIIQAGKARMNSGALIKGDFNIKDDEIIRRLQSIPSDKPIKEYVHKPMSDRYGQAEY